MVTSHNFYMIYLSLSFVSIWFLWFWLSSIPAQFPRNKAQSQIRAAKIRIDSYIPGVGQDRCREMSGQQSEPSKSVLIPKSDLSEWTRIRRCLAGLEGYRRSNCALENRAASMKHFSSQISARFATLRKTCFGEYGHLLIFNCETDLRLLLMSSK